MGALVASGLAVAVVAVVGFEGALQGVWGARPSVGPGGGAGGWGGGRVVLYMGGAEADARNANHANVWKQSRETEEKGWPKVPGKFRVPRFNNAPDR